MPGFWETFSQGAQGALGDYDRVRQDKRQRALQKLKFLTENSDVGSQVDPTAANDIRRHAEEGAPLIGEDNTFTGTPEQQRLHAWRQTVEQNPDMDPLELLTKGVGAGAVSGGTLGNALNTRDSLQFRQQNAEDQRNQQYLMHQERMRNQQDLQQERMENQRTLRSMMSRGSGDSSEDYEMGTRADTQKWRANRRMFGNDPLSYVRKNLLGTPEAAQAELEGVYSDLQRSGQSVPGMPDVNSPESWEVYSRYHSMPEVMLGKRDELGMTPQEYREYMNYIQKVIATARKRKGNAQ
jgi:hypothetical protein